MEEGGMEMMPEAAGLMGKNKVHSEANPDDGK